MESMNELCNQNDQKDRLKVIEKGDGSELKRGKVVLVKTVVNPCAAKKNFVCAAKWTDLSIDV